MRVSDINLRESSSVGVNLNPSSKNIEQQAVKVIIHQDLGSSVGSFADEGSQEQLGLTAVQQF